MSEYFVEDCIYRLKRIAFVVFATFPLIMFGDSVSYAQVAPTPTVSITASPQSIPLGGQTTVTWTSTNTTSCTVEALASNAALMIPSNWTGTSGSKTLNLNSSQAFNINCSWPGPNGGGASVSANAMVKVDAPPPPLITSVSPSSGSTLGGNTVTITGNHLTGTAAVYFGGSDEPGTNISVLSDSEITVTAPAISPGTVNLTVVTPAGPNTVNPPADAYTYVAQASDVSTQAATPAATVNISAHPEVIAYGSPVTVSWSSTNATSCSVSPSGWSGTSGSQTQTPTSSQTYTVTCTGSGNTVWGTASVSVLPQEAVSPAPTPAPSPAPTPSPAPEPPLTPSSPPPPVPTLASGSNSSPPPPPPPVPIVTFSASPNLISEGHSAMLNWTSMNATNCTGDGFSPSGTSGALPVSPSITTTYSITCTGDGGSANQHATVNVMPQSSPSHSQGLPTTFSNNLSQTADASIPVTNETNNTVMGSSNGNNNIGAQPQAGTVPSDSSPAGATSARCTFTRDLDVGMVGEDVKCLQIYLNANGFTLTSSGPGSPGNETDRYGGFTREALVEWQTRYGIFPASGYFGQISRAKYDELIIGASSNSPTSTSNSQIGTSQTAASISSLMPAVATSIPGLDCSTMKSDKARNMVVITHGYSDNVDGWVKDMAASIATSIKMHFGTVTTDWTVCTFDWSKDADTGWPVDGWVSFITSTNGSGLDVTAPEEAYWWAERDGYKLGTALSSENLASIHFIGHSAGAEVIQTAAEQVRLNSNGTNIHLTFLDAYDPKRSDSQYGLDPLPKTILAHTTSTWFAEQYVDMRDNPILTSTNIVLKHAYNFDITNLDFNQSKPIISSLRPWDESLKAYSLRVHHWPQVWYQNSIDALNIRTFFGGPLTNAYKYGFQLSLESGAPPTSDHEAGGCLALSNSGTTDYVTSKCPPSDYPQSPAQN